MCMPVYIYFSDWYSHSSGSPLTNMGIGVWEHLKATYSILVNNKVPNWPLFLTIFSTIFELFHSMSHSMVRSLSLLCSLFQEESWSHITLISRGSQMLTELFFNQKQDAILCMFIVSVSWVSYQSVIVNNTQSIKYTTYLFNTASNNVLVRCRCISGLILMSLHHARHNFLLIAKSKFHSSKISVSSDSTQPREGCTN